MAEAYIVAAVRTAGGKRNGKLSGWHPVDLAASVLDELIADSREVVKECDEVVNEWEESARRGVIRHVEEDEIFRVVGEGV
jgi:acetyl-CoA acetyltransferase